MSSPWLDLLIAPALGAVSVLVWRHWLGYIMRIRWGYGKTEGRPAPRTFIVSRYFTTAFIALLALGTFIHAVRQLAW